MKYSPFSNPVRNGLCFSVMDLGRKEENLSNQDQVFREIGVCKIPKRSCSYENIHCLVKLEAHGIEL